MSKRVVVVLILAAACLTAFSHALSRRDSRDWRANRSRRLFPFPWQDTTAIAIDKPDGTTLSFMKDKSGEWRIRLPDSLADTLSNRAADEFAALATLTWREPLKGARAPEAGGALRLTATGAGGQKVEFAFGATVSNLRSLVIDGDDDVVYGVNQDLVSFLDWPESQFREMYLAAAGTAMKPKKIVLSPAGASEDLLIEMERSDTGWRMTRPVSWPVDESRLGLLTSWLERLRAETIEAEMSADLKWFGFTDASTSVEVVYDGPEGETRRRIEFGKSVDDDGDLLYARVVGRLPIFGVGKEMLSEISLDVAEDHPSLWRNFYRRRALNTAGSEMPAAITVERLLPSPEKLTLEQYRDRDTIRWRGVLESGGTSRSFKVDPPDANEPMRPLTALITGLSSLRVKAFLADAAPGPRTIKWTAFPAWRFTCTAPDGTTLPSLTLYAHDMEGGLPAGQPYLRGRSGPQEMRPKPGLPEKVGMAFSLQDQSAVMETFADLAYLLCLPPYRYETKKLHDFDARSWSRVAITAGATTTTYVHNPKEINEQWWRLDEEPEPLMDDNNLFVSMLLELSQLRTEGYVAERADTAGAGAEEFGLDQPTITAIVYISQDGKSGESPDTILFTLSVGDAADPSGTMRFARINEAGPVFLVNERLARALGGEYR